MPAPTDVVSRFDVASLGQPERTPQGFLRVPAYLTRTGVLEYRRADGEVVREYRPASEVFRARSLSTLAAAPLTDLHPTEMVSPTNVRTLSIGHVVDEVKADGAMVSAAVIVQDGDAISKVERGERRELSCGYRCRIDATPGVTPDGHAYDVVQRDIVYNHVALGPRGWGRAGRDVALRVDEGDAADGGDVFRLDAADAVSVLTFDAPGDEDERWNAMDMVTIRVDGVDAPAPKQTAQLFEKALTTRDDALGEAVAERDTLQGRVDTLEAELKQAKTELAAANDPKRLDAVVAERTALLEQARRFLPPDTKLDGLSVHEVKLAVLKHLHPQVDYAGRNDSYISGAYESTIATAKPVTWRPGSRSDALDDARRVTTTTPGLPAPHSRQDGVAAPYVPPWMRPTSVTKRD